MVEGTRAYRFALEIWRSIGMCVFNLSLVSRQDGYIFLGCVIECSQWFYTSSLIVNNNVECISGEVFRSI